MSAYYNEIDPYAAQWLRNLIAAGHIAPGDVDERSIEDVHPDELRGYTQCHFFAGIGVWSYALRRAGWPDDRPVWTGSCPCQPFSAAGRQSGFADERHLWPAWHWLIGERRPAVILGEQVAGSAVDPWIDLVQADVEAMDYAFGCVPFPSAGVNAPHIRDRAYWLAYANGMRREGLGRRRKDRAAERREAGGMADPQRRAAERQRLDMGSAPGGVRSSSREQRVRDDARDGCDIVRLADSDNGRCVAHASGAVLDAEHHAQPRGGPGGMGDADHLPHSPQRSVRSGENAARIRGAADGPASPADSLWRDVDWLLCRDGKWRPVEPGTFPLADGAPARVGRLRAYGNAINAEAARAFIETCIELI